MAKSKKKTSKKTKTDKVPEPDHDLWFDDRGKFAAGNPGGPGRPFLRQQRFLVAINDAVDPDTWKEIIQRAVDDAKAGDYRARDWLSKWLLGEPDPARVDERRTIIEVLTDNNFLKWIEAGGRDETQE